MIIKAKPFKFKYLQLIGKLMIWILNRRFNKLKINETEVLKDHSYLLMCNHFSFWDGFLGGYLTLRFLNKHNPNIKGFYIMSLDKQIMKHRWLTRFGSFSIAPGSKTMHESFEYAAEILDTPGNVFLMFPQGNLESNHVRNIVIKPGLAEVMKRVKGNCQLVWSSNLVDYFENLKPSVHFHLLNCGTAKDFNLERFTANVNSHHKNAIKKQFRFTEEN